jgi:hypothetical protein
VEQALSDCARATSAVQSLSFFKNGVGQRAYAQ